MAQHPDMIAADVAARKLCARWMRDRGTTRIENRPLLKIQQHANYLASPPSDRRIMSKLPFVHALSRRERQIMDVLYRYERAGVAEVLAELPSPPSYSAVRATMRILEEKGHVRHVADGARYVYE